MFSSCTAEPSEIEAFNVVAKYPHDNSAYTQGLEFVDGKLLESTGLYGQSSLRFVEPTDGTVIEQINLSDNYFAEGTTVVDDQIYQLTWQSGKLFIRDLNDLNAEPKTINYSGEGWGICLLEDQIIRSDGTNTLTFHEPETFIEVKKVEIVNDRSPLNKINELECVAGFVWANVYQSNIIHKIDPNSGEVLQSYDFTSLVPDELIDSNEYVLNGIAYNSTTGHFWLTGKNWPVIYEIEIP